MMKSNRGFTLVEVLVAVVIVGIISAIAYPSYISYIVKSKRADGMGALMNASQAMERYKINNFNYNVGSDLSQVFATQVPVDGGVAYYNLSIVSDNTSYTLTATPTGSMTGQDGPLTLTHTGARTWVDDKGALHACWPESSSSC